MPILGSYSLGHLHSTPAVLGVAPDLGLFTRSSIYSSPLVCKIVVKSLDKSETHYTFDPFFFSGTSEGVIYCNVNLSLSHHGTFEFQIDDHDKTLDIDNIINGKRVIISMGKTANNMFTHLSGMIRQTGYTRGCEDNLLYNVSGFGTGIRFNERVLDVLEDEPFDDFGSIVNKADPDFFARKVVKDALDRSSYYPRGISTAEVEGSNGLGYVNSTQVTQSDIKDFIPGVVLRFGEIADLYNQIENFTGARISVDMDDIVHIQAIKTPLTSNTGFKITTNPLLDSDFADNTMYIDAEHDYTYTDSISKDAGYSNSLFGILPASAVPDKDAADSDNDYFENKTVEIAQRFKPITNPHWRLYAGVEGVGLTNIQSENSVRGRWRICADNDGIPQNTSGIISNRYMYPNEFYSTSDGGTQVIEIFGKGSNDLDENTWYWLILSSVNATATEYWRWYKDSNVTGEGAQVMTASPGTSSSTDGGTGWTAIKGARMEMFQTRFKAEPYNVLDPLGVRKRIVIESVVPTFPQQIATKTAATKYLLGLIRYSSRPRTIFEFPSLTVPNKPVFPGDTACIVDDRFNFSTPGNEVVGGQITDVNYSMGIRGGGLSRSSKGQSSLSLSVVAFSDHY